MAIRVRIFACSTCPSAPWSPIPRRRAGITASRAADVTENITVDEMLVKPRSGFKLVHSLVDFLNADHVEMYFTSVTFEDGAVWKPEDGDLVEIGEQPVLQGEALDRLRAAAGDDARAISADAEEFLALRVRAHQPADLGDLRPLWARPARGADEVQRKGVQRQAKRSRAAAESAPGEQAGKAESVRGARGTGGGDRRADAAARAAGVPARAHERKGRFGAAAVCDGSARV